MDTEGSERRRRDTMIVGALLAVALVWRVVFVVEMEASPYGGTLTLDSEVYHRLAIAAAEGRWPSGETFYQAPLYPVTLGMVYSVFGPSQPVSKLLQVLLGVASCWFVYRIANRVFDRRVAQIALALAAVYGMSIFFANELLAVNLVVFLDLLGLGVLLRAVDGARKLPWATAGVVFGISAITRPTILPFVAAVAVWAVISGWRTGRLRSAVGTAAVFLAAVAVPVLPVTLHNLLADGDPVLVASNGGFNFFIGNNPDSDGVTAAAPGVRPDRGGAEADQARAAREALGAADATPKEISDYWYGRAWKYIRSDPLWALRHTAYKTLVFFNASEVSNTRVIAFVTRHSSIFTWATIGFWLVLPLAVAGVVMGGGNRPQRTLLLLFVGVYSATVVAFFVNARFRMPVVGVVIVFAAAAVASLVARLGRRRIDRRLVMAVAAALVTALLIRPLPDLRVADAQAYFNEAEAYRSHADFANAARWYEKALTAYPGYCDAAYNLARIHTDIAPDPQRVIAVLTPVMEVCAEDAGIHELMGRALYAVGRSLESAPSLESTQPRKPELSLP